MGSYRVALRALEPQDCVMTHAWRSDATYLESVLSMNRLVSMDTERRWIEAAIKEHETLKALRFAVMLKEDKEFIGLSMLKAVDFVNRQARSSIFLSRCRGEGLGKEALMLTLEYAFLEMNLEKVSAAIMVPNTPSIRLYEKLGFVREGIRRRAIFKHGGFVDICDYGLLREEFIALCPELPEAQCNASE